MLRNLSNGAEVIEHRILGKTGIRASVLGFGGSEIGYSAVAQKTVDRIVGAALDAGITVYDTAECYADGERLLGRALGKRRKDVAVMTKCGHAMLASAADRAGGFAKSEWDPVVLERSIDRSSKLLGTDYVDIIQFHSPPPEVLDSPGAIRVLERARDAGKARFIGCSLDSTEAARAVETDVFDTLQISVSIADQEAIDLVMPKARARGIGVIAKRPIANAVWASASMRTDWYSRPYWERLQELNFDFLKTDTAAATALRFTLSVPGVHCAIVGTTRPERIGANISAVKELPLPKPAYDKIRARWREVARPDWVGQR